MSDYAQLIEQLTTQLEKFGYSREDNIDTPNISYILYVDKPPLLKVRNLCALLDIPSVIKENSSAKNYFKNVQKSLLSRYGDALLWKELETCFVVLCDHDLYDILKSDGGEAVTHANFSLNTMMGTCFIDKTTFDNFNQSAWGIYFSSDHYTTVRETVANWCKQQKNE